MNSQQSDLWFVRLLGQREREENGARREGNVLPPIHGVGHWRTLDPFAGLKLPQQLAIGRVQSDQVTVSPGSKYQSSGRCQHSGGGRTVLDGKVPTPIPGRSIEGANRAG